MLPGIAGHLRGFCTSGMLLTCKVLSLAYLKPTREQIGCYLNGNICRCGAYVQILETIQAVVKARQGDASGPPWPLRVATCLPMQPRPMTPRVMLAGSLS